MTDHLVLQLLVPNTPATSHLAALSRSHEEGGPNPLVYLDVVTCASCGGDVEHVADSAQNRWGGATVVQCKVCRRRFVYRRALIDVTPSKLTPQLATWTADAKTTVPRDRPLPLAPLLRMLHVPSDVPPTEPGPLGTLALRFGEAFPDRAHSARQVVHRWNQRGLTVEEADTLATALGHHPSEVWANWSEVAGLVDVGGTT